jgi:hypothetical protein
VQLYRALGGGWQQSSSSGMAGLTGTSSLSTPGRLAENHQHRLKITKSLRVEGMPLLLHSIENK